MPNIVPRIKPIFLSLIIKYAASKLDKPFTISKDIP